jgi:hypothetical protein
MIDLTDTAIDTAALAVLQGTGLTRLNLGYTRVTDASVPLLITLPLVELDLSKTQITDAGLVRLVEIKTLKRLSIGKNLGGGYTDAGIAAFEKLRPDVEVVK